MTPKMEPGHRLLPGVASFRVGDPTDLIVAHLLRQGTFIDLGPERRPPAQDAGRVEVSLASGQCPGAYQPRGECRYSRFRTYRERNKGRSLGSQGQGHRAHL